MNKSIEVPILNDEYFVVVCWGTEKFVRKIGRYFHHEKEIKLLKNDRGTCYFYKKCAPIIVLPGYPKTCEEFGTLAHEAVHAVKNIFEHIDEDICKSEEVFPHSVGAVVRIVLEKGKNKNKK